MEPPFLIAVPLAAGLGQTVFGKVEGCGRVLQAEHRLGCCTGDVQVRRHATKQPLEDILRGSGVLFLASNFARWSS